MLAALMASVVLFQDSENHNIYVCVALLSWLHDDFKSSDVFAVCPLGGRGGRPWKRGGGECTPTDL